MNQGRPRGAASVLAVPGAARLLLAAVAGRLAYGALPVAVLLSLARPGSLAVATSLASLQGLLASLSLPVKGRLVDRYGGRVLRLLAVTGLLSLAGSAVLVGRHAPVGAVAVGVCSAALLTPPLTAVVRACWGRVLLGHEQLRDAAFALDAGLEEAAFLVGPALGGVLFAAVGGSAVLVGAGVLLAVAGCGLAGRVPTATVTAPGQRPRLGPAVRPATAVLALGAVLQGVVGAAVLMRATSLGGAGLYGVLLSTEGVGALLGLLLLGPAARRLAPDRRTVALVTATAGCALLLVPATTVTSLVLALVVVGLPSALLVATVNAVVSADERAGGSSQAFSVLVTGQNLGGLGGFAVGGVLVQALGTGPAVLCGVAVAVVGWLVVVPRLR